MTIPIDNGSRINGTGPTAVRSKPAQTEKAAAGSDARGRERSGAADASFASERLQQVRERIDATPEIDNERVETIKRALAEGRLAFDPERIAQKFASLEGLLDD